MPWWKCDKCGYSFQASMPPEDSTCPNCREKCTFKDVTCYIPECGLGEDDKEHIDHRL
jgi:rubredoxin